MKLLVYIITLKPISKSVSKLPTIKTGIAYKISDDTRSLESKLFFLEDGTEYDIGTLDSDSLLTYYFEAK